MNSDDALAGMAILLGASVPTLATIVLLTQMGPAAGTGSQLELATTPGGGSIVDYAIIRDEVDLMVGPEGPHSGWHGRVEFTPSGPREP